VLQNLNTEILEEFQPEGFWTRGGVFQVPTLNNSPSIKLSSNSPADFLISTDAAGPLIGVGGSDTDFQRLVTLRHFLSCFL